MHYQINQQYHSSTTEEPTVALGQMEARTSKEAESSRRKDHRRGQTSFQENYLQMKNQYLKELQICHSQIETLKEQVQMEEKQKAGLQETIINLKRDLSQASKQTNRIFSENQRNKQLIQKLRIDNKSMEMEIQKFRGERKIYYGNLNNIEALKRDIAQQLAQKTSAIQEGSNRLRKLERVHSECKFKMEELERTVNEKEDQRKQLVTEVRDGLQKYITQNNLISKLEHQVREVNDLNRNMADKIHELERERQQFLAKLGYTEGKESLSQSGQSNFYPHQRSMVEIQSYMRQIQNLLDLKRDEQERKRKNYDQLKIAVQCLQQNL